MRRQHALAAQPNPAHLALAAYSKNHPNTVFTITQNTDGLGQRAGHPETNLLEMHGSLFTLKCLNCDYKEQNLQQDLIGEKATLKDLPKCPRCASLLRPGVVWFGEGYTDETLHKIDSWLSGADLILVVGTSGTVWPAAGYADLVRLRGGKVAVFNVDDDDGADWMFTGKCESTLPLELN
jgi:NAD-dependent deacetylase sirtuin 5